jgi:hypothetical protein
MRLLSKVLCNMNSPVFNSVYIYSSLCLSATDMFPHRLIKIADCTVLALFPALADKTHGLCRIAALATGKS